MTPYTVESRDGAVVSLHLRLLQVNSPHAEARLDLGNHKSRTDRFVECCSLF